jgi:hypothetical protein
VEEVEKLVARHLICAGKISQERLAEMCGPGGVGVQASKLRHMAEVILQEGNDLGQEISFHAGRHVGVQGLFEQNLLSAPDGAVTKEVDNAIHAG